MFNIRNLVNRIAKAGEGDSSQGETSSSKSRSESVSSYSQEASSSAAAEAEGFLCPACYSNFTNPEELQLHYEQVHQDPGANYLCPVCKARLRNSLELEQHYAVNHMNQGPVKSGSLDDMRKELTSLNSTLLEERWQSDELRKEVENLKKMLQASGTSEESEAYGQQIQGLEESKALLMSEVLLLRKQLSEALESSSSLRSERDKLGEKLAKSSRDVAELQASLDETQGMKAALQERVNLMENQLSQRENVDDAGVLKRELASVQRVMDQLSKDKEEELNQMKTVVKDLQSQQEVSTNELNALRESFEALQRFADSVQEEKNKLQADLENVELTKQKLQETEQQLSQMQTLRDETDICVARLREEVTSLQVMLNQARHEAEGEVSAKQDELLQLKLQLLNHQQQVARLESSCESLQAENKDLRQELTAGKNLFDSELRSKQAKESELKDLEQKQQKLQQKLLVLEKEKDELVMKISAGEGLNTAIEQLQSQNQALQLEIQEGSQNLATLKNQHDEIVNEKLKLESQMEVLKQQLAETNEENAKKDKRIKELVGMTESLKEEALKAEKSWNTDKEKLQEKLEDSMKAKDGLENQLQSLSAEKKALEKENSKILEKQKELESQLSNQMKSYEALEHESNNSKIKYSEAMTLIGGQETKIQELTNQIAVLNEKLDQSNNEEIRLKTANDQLEKFIEMLKNQSEASLNEMENKLKLMTETNGRYELTGQQLQEEVQQLKEDLAASTAKCEALDKQAEAQVQRIADLEKMISGKDVILHDNEQTIKSQNAEIVRDKSRIAEMEEKMQLLDKEKRSLAALLESEQNARTKEKRDYEEAEQLLKGEKESLETLTTHLQNQMDELRTEHRIHLQRLKNDMDAVSEEKNQLATQLVAAKETAESEKASREETKTRLESQIKSLTSQLAKVNEELGSRTRRCDELQSLVEQSRGRTLELEAQAAVLEEDKKELQSRCGQWEIEAEKIKVASVELRRRLEDSQAALHELGRENQSLQMENAKLQDRKWADDSEVRQCLGCSKDFSITVRKHHCRNCGQIFCSDCSAKQTPIGQSKKPVRVCDPCFKELQNSR